MNVSQFLSQPSGRKGNCKNYFTTCVLCLGQLIATQHNFVHTHALTSHVVWFSGTKISFVPTLPDPSGSVLASRSPLDRDGQLWADPVACVLVRGRRSTRNAISCPRMPSDRELQGGGRPEHGRSSTVVGRKTLPWPAGADPQGFEVGRDAGRPQALASLPIMHLVPVPSQAPFPPYNRLRRKNPDDRSRYQRGWRIIIFLFHFLQNFR